jgi:hypothetical protein
MWRLEFLLIFGAIAIVVFMTWYASTVTQYFAAAITIISGLYAAYDYSRPSQEDFTLDRCDGLIALVVAGVMVSVYITTFF